MDYQEFTKKYGTEKQCLEYLFNLRWENGYRCPRCNHNEMWEIRDFKYKCKKCGYQTTVLAGTLFQDTHIPINRWFEAIWYITSNKEKLTATALQHQLGLGSNRTALSMLKKIRYAMFSTKQVKLKGKIELYQEYNYSEKNKLNILLIAVEINNKKIGRIKLKRVDSRDYKEINDFVETNIENGSVIYCKKWHGISDLVSKGYICKVKTDRYTFPYSNKIKNKFKSWLKENCNNNKIRISYNVYACNAFCKEFNKYKLIPTFDELLINAINLPPKPCEKNVAKK